MAGRSRFFVIGRCQEGATESLAVSQAVPYNATLLQITMAITAVPTTSESLTIIKDSVLGPGFDVVLFTIDPAEEGKQDVVCNGRWEFRMGDAIVATYTNTDDNGVGFEAVFTEGD